MNVLKHKVPLTESFLMQLDADLEGLRGNSKSETQKFAFGLRYGEVSPVGASKLFWRPGIMSSSDIIAFRT